MPLNCQDKMDIQELICRYAISMDTERFDDWSTCWAEDGVWEGGLGVYSGRAELAKLPIDMGSRIRNKRHVMTNFLISGEGNEATSTCYMTIVERETSTDIVATGVYHDTLRRIDGVWKFTQRKVQLDPGRTTKNLL